MSKNSRVRILSIVPRSINGKGGVETFSCQLRDRIEQHWSEKVEIYFAPTRGTESSLVWPVLFIFRLFKIFSLIGLGRYDVVHLNVSWGISNYRKLLISLIAKLFRVPVVSHSHAGGLERALKGNFKWLRAYRLVLSWAALNIVLGEQWRVELPRRFSIPEDKFHVIRNGVSDYNPAGKISGDNFSGEKLDILFAGEVGPRKGIDKLINALSILKSIGQKFSCTIAGNGLVDEYQRLARDLDLTNEVQFLGWQPGEGIRRLMQQNSIFCLPSAYENFPMSLVEAACAGCAIITCPAGVLGEIFLDGRNALVVEASISSLVAACEQLLRTPRLASELGTAARETYLTYLTPEATLDELVQCLIDTANRKTRLC